MADVLSGTSFTGGIKYQATATATPAIGEICDNTASGISVNYKGDIFSWNWTTQVGDTPALIVEDTGSTFD